MFTNEFKTELKNYSYIRYKVNHTDCFDESNWFSLLAEQEEKIKGDLVAGITLLSQLGLITTEASSSQGKLWLTPYYITFRDHAIVLQSRIMDEKSLDEYLELVP